MHCWQTRVKLDIDRNAHGLYSVHETSYLAAHAGLQHMHNAYCHAAMVHPELQA
jgi:hypothetical protein